MKNERTIKKLLLAGIALCVCIVMLVASIGCVPNRSSDGGLLEGCAACTALCAGCTCVACSALTCAATEGIYCIVPGVELS